MKRWLLLLLVVSPGLCRAQIHSIGVAGETVFGLSKRPGIESARGTGGSVEIRLAWGDVLIGLAAGYANFHLNQADQLNAWGWDFWNDRYYPKIQSDMRADPNLSARIGSVQTMDLIPVALTVASPWEVSDDLRLLPSVAAGAAFFTRKLYADETWTKQYPQSDYSLTYNLRNFAPDKKGRSYFVAAGCQALYTVAGGVEVTAGLQYRQYLTAVTGSGLFPFTSALGAWTGVSFTY